MIDNTPIPTTDSNKYKVRIYKDNRMLITMHDFNPFQSSKPIIPIRSKNKSLYEKQYMSKKAYIKLLYSAHRKLWDREYNQENCFFVTLTLKEILSIKELQKHFRRFLINVKNHFGKVQYIRAFELHEDTNRFHTHSIIEFQEVPKQFNKSIVEGLWKLGLCEVEKVYDIMGVLQYITKPKEHHIQKDNRYFTYLPKGSKLIACSQKFGTSLDSNSYFDDYVTAEHLSHIIGFHLKECGDNNGNFVRIDGHYYFDDRSSEIAHCMDRVFIRSTKDFIDSNFLIPNKK